MRIAFAPVEGLLTQTNRCRIFRKPVKFPVRFKVNAGPPTVTEVGEIAVMTGATLSKATVRRSSRGWSLYRSKSRNGQRKIAEAKGGDATLGSDRG